jgi:hypothetical protein
MVEATVEKVRGEDLVKSESDYLYWVIFSGAFKNSKIFF